MDQLFTGSRRFRSTKLLAMDHINDKVQVHLTKVYGFLAALTVACGVGAYLQVMINMNTAWMGLIALGLMVFSAYQYITRKSLFEQGVVMMLFAFVQGLSMGPLIQLALDVNPSILIAALSATGAIFLSFSGFSMLSKRRSYLYLGSILSSVLSGFIFLSFIHIFTGGQTIPLIHLYGGLFVFIGYIVYDTQVIIEKADLGDTNYVNHAKELFIDLLGVFIRILIILLRNNEKKKKSKKK